MDPAPTDVFVSYAEPSGRQVAEMVEAALTRRGFRVHVTQSGRSDLAIAEQAADFVAVMTPGALAVYEDRESAAGAELFCAILAEHNIIPLYMPGVAPASGTSAAATALTTYQAVSYLPHATDESLARVAHRLTSTATREERHLSRQTKWMAAIVAVVIAGIAITAVVRLWPRRTEVPPLPPLAVSVAVFGQHQTHGQWTELVLQDGASVAPGDQVRVVFAVNGDASAYVVAQDARGGVSVLFPEREVKGGSRVRGGEMNGAPTAARWVTVEDIVGPLTLSVIASYDTIENLESIVEEREGEASAQERQAVLQATIAGLLDGRHAILASPIRTRKGAAILQSLASGSPRAPSTTNLALSSGAVATRPMTTSTGLLSVLSEIRLHVIR